MIQSCDTHYKHLFFSYSHLSHVLIWLSAKWILVFNRLLAYPLFEKNQLAHFLDLIFFLYHPKNYLHEDSFHIGLIWLHIFRKFHIIAYNCIYIHFYCYMSLKIDSILILASSSNYLEWEQQIKHFLQSEDLFSHIEEDEINSNALWPASYPLILAKNSTAAKCTKFRNWWKDDAYTMLIIK